MKLCEATHINIERFEKYGEAPMPIFNNDDFKMYYDDLGEGIPIVFIHPPGMGRMVFLFQTLLQEHFRVIFPDLSGHGDSVGTSSNVSIERFVNEIKSLLDHLHLSQAVICGYSAGGTVAQEFVLTYPERTLGTILLSSYPKVQSEVLKDEHLIGMFMAKKFPRFLAKCIVSAHTNRKDINKILFEHMIKSDQETWFQYYEKSLNYSCLNRLSQLQVHPLLLIYGEKDFANQHMRAYRYIPHQLEVVKNVSHQVLVKKWERFNQIVTEFVSENIK